MNSLSPRILVLGAGGMLGHKLVQELSRTMDVVAAMRSSSPAFDAAAIAPPDRIRRVDAFDLPSLDRTLDETQPAVVVNAIGVIKQSPLAIDAARTIATNALFPHQLAERAEKRGVRVIHISTDCVFAGTRGKYREDDAADARDLYGLSKFLGELHGAETLTLRTSIVGRELQGHRALTEWFLQSRGRVKGYERAIFSGLTTIQLSRLIGQLITAHPRLHGLYHVAAAPIAKLDLLRQLKVAFDVPVEIDASNDLIIDRSLDGARFREATGFEAPDWPAMIAEMRRDSTPYDALHALPAPSDSAPSHA